MSSSCCGQLGLSQCQRFGMPPPLGSRGSQLLLIPAYLRNSARFRCIMDGMAPRLAVSSSLGAINGAGNVIAAAAAVAGSAGASHAGVTSALAHVAVTAVAIASGACLSTKVDFLWPRLEDQPADWWLAYGQGAPNLQNFAIKVLSLTCSSSGCERNWSIFEFLHSKRRSKMDHGRLKDLVYVKYNRALIRRYNHRDTLDPISLTDIDDANEWLTGKFDDEDIEEDTEALIGEDLTWSTVARASGVYERSYNIRDQSKGKQKESSSRFTPTTCEDEDEEGDEEDEEDEENYNIGDENEGENEALLGCNDDDDDDELD